GRPILRAIRQTRFIDIHVARRGARGIGVVLRDGRAVHVDGQRGRRGVAVRVNDRVGELIGLALLQAVLVHGVGVVAVVVDYERAMVADDRDRVAGARDGDGAALGALDAGEVG